MPAIFGKVPAARGARRWRCLRGRATADPQPRSLGSVSAAQNQFSHIQKLIDEQNRSKLAQVAKEDLIRYLREIAPFEEDFDVAQDELVEVLMLSSNSGDTPEDGVTGWNDLDLSFLDEGLPPDDDVFKFTDDNNEFDKGPMPTNETDNEDNWIMYPSRSPPVPGAMHALIRERNMDPSYAADSAADAMDWHSEDTGERDSGAYLDAQVSDPDSGSWPDQDNERQLETELDSRTAEAVSSIVGEGGSGQRRSPSSTAESGAAGQQREGDSGQTVKENMHDSMPLGDIQYTGIVGLQKRQGSSQKEAEGGMTRQGGMEGEVQMEEDEWGDGVSSAEDEVVLYEYGGDREIEDVLDHISNNADGRDILDIINEEVLEDDEDQTFSDFGEDEGSQEDSRGSQRVGGANTLKGSRPLLPWQQPRSRGEALGHERDDAFVGVESGNNDEDFQGQRKRVGYLRGDIEGPEEWGYEGEGGGLGAMGDEMTEEQAAELMEEMGLAREENPVAAQAQRRELQESLVENAAAVSPDTDGILTDPTVLGLDRTWGGADAAIRSGDRGPPGTTTPTGDGTVAAGVPSSSGAPAGWTWAGIGALQSWDEGEMAREIDEIKRELMSGQQGGHSVWEAAVEDSMMSESDGYGGAAWGVAGSPGSGVGVLAAESGDRGSRRETAGRLHRREVSSVRSASVAAVQSSAAGLKLPLSESAAVEEASDGEIPKPWEQQQKDTETEREMAKSESAPKKRGRKHSTRGRKKDAPATATAAAGQPTPDAVETGNDASVALVLPRQAQEEQAAQEESAASAASSSIPAAAAAAPVRKKRGRPKKARHSNTTAASSSSISSSTEAATEAAPAEVEGEAAMPTRSPSVRARNAAADLLAAAATGAASSRPPPTPAFPGPPGSPAAPDTASPPSISTSGAAGGSVDASEQPQPLEVDPSPSTEGKSAREATEAASTASAPAETSAPGRGSINTSPQASAEQLSDSSDVEKPPSEPSLAEVPLQASEAEEMTKVSGSTRTSDSNRAQKVADANVDAAAGKEAADTPASIDPAADKAASIDTAAAVAAERKAQPVADSVPAADETDAVAEARVLKQTKDASEQETLSQAAESGDTSTPAADAVQPVKAEAAMQQQIKASDEMEQSPGALNRSSPDVTESVKAVEQSTQDTAMVPGAGEELAEAVLNSEQDDSQQDSTASDKPTLSDASQQDKTAAAVTEPEEAAGAPVQINESRQSTTAAAAAAAASEPVKAIEATKGSDKLEQDDTKKQSTAAEAEATAPQPRKRGRPRMTEAEKARKAEGKMRTRVEREKEALDLWAGVEVRKEKLLWLEGEVDRMRVHAVAAEQRQKLLLEVQDLRAQLEGWSDSATMRAQLGELRDPSLFPPQDRSLQRRAEVTVDTLQDEVDGLREQLAAREDAAEALQQDINAEFGNDPGVLRADPSGTDSTSPGGTPQSDSTPLPPQRIGFDSEDLAQAAASSSGSAFGSNSSNKVSRESGGGKGQSQVGTDEATRDLVLGSLQENGKGTGSGNGIAGGQPAAAATTSDGSDSATGASTSMEDGEGKGSSAKVNEKRAGFPKVGQFVNWIVNSVLPRPWK